MKTFMKADKGKKDRQSILPQKFIPPLQQYQKEYKSCYGLFEGQEYGQYSVHTVQAILRQALDQ
jgi:hypothetical protein